MKKRLITAAIGLPILILVLFVLPDICMMFVAASAVAIAAYELLWRTGLVKHLRLVIYSATMAAFCGVQSYFGLDYAWLFLGILVFVCLVFAELLISHGKLPFAQIGLCMVGGVLVPYMVCALVRIRVMEHGVFLIAVPFIAAFMSDASAYFAGRFLGKHKLAPNISPNKTIEGVIGGVVGAVSGMLIFGLILWLGFSFKVNFLFAAIYGLVGSGLGVCGDLCFSAIKRQTGIKDYGNLFPGHGGIVDRLDSLSIVSPAMELLLLLIPLAVK